MPNAISQHFTDELLSRELTLNEKIVLFSDGVHGWQLDVAERLLSDRHAGWAILSIISSYFEMIATYDLGEWVRGKSKEYCKHGLKRVLDAHRIAAPSHMPDAVFDAVLDVIWEDVRCGLYHAGSAGPRVLIRIADEMPIVGYEAGVVQIDPKKLLESIQLHFRWYIGALLNPDTRFDRLRKNFAARFDQATVTAPTKRPRKPRGKAAGS
jgi:hypothetical protein